MGGGGRGEGGRGGRVSQRPDKRESGDDSGPLFTLDPKPYRALVYEGSGFTDAGLRI